MARIIIDLPDMEKIIDWFQDEYIDEIENAVRNHVKNPWWADPANVFENYLEQYEGLTGIGFSCLPPKEQAELAQSLESIREKAEKEMLVDKALVLQLFATLTKIGDDDTAPKNYRHFCNAENNITKYEVADAVRAWCKQFE